MKTILIIALIAMVLTTGFAAAADMTNYDTNTDGMIDIDERMILDIDIERARLTPAEILVIDSYTIDGTILLNEEFQAAFLNPATLQTVTTVTVAPDPAETVEELTPLPEEPAPVLPVVPVPAPEQNGSNSNMIIFVGFVIFVAIAIFAYYALKDKEDDKKE